MDLNSIMSNIYGENAPQNFDSLSLSGGKINYKRSKIKYLDESIQSDNNDTTNSIEADYSFKANKIFPTLGNLFSISGGATKSTIYPSAEYVEDSGLKTFIKEFFLHYLVSNIHKNTILIVPSDSTLKKMVDDFKSKLKSENIEEYSPDASRYAAKTELPFKNYIFDVYGKETPDNDGFPYQVSSEFPSTGMTDVLRRTNRLSKVYFFKFVSESEIKVATNEKMSGASSLKFLAKADHDCFILKGDVPAVSEGKSSNIVTATLSGGNKSNYLRNYFLSLVSKYNNDLDMASYDFIGVIGAAGDDIQNEAKKLSKYYSGDYLHTAFSILSDNQEFDINKDADENDINDVHSAIIDNYTPKKSLIKMNKVYDVLPRIYKNCKSAKSGLQASKIFISTIKKMYETISAPPYMIQADIATAMCKQNNSLQNVRNALHIIDEIKRIDDNPSAFDGPDNNSYFNSSIKMSDKTVISPLVSTVYGAISSSPFIGSVAREYTPMLLSTPKRSHKSFKPKASFEEDKNINQDDEGTLQFSILNDDDSSPISKQNENSVKDIDIDFDVKSFF